MGSTPNCLRNCREPSDFYISRRHITKMTQSNTFLKVFIVFGLACFELCLLYMHSDVIYYVLCMHLYILIAHALNQGLTLHVSMPAG